MGPKKFKRPLGFLYTPNLDICDAFLTRKENFLDDAQRGIEAEQVKDAPLASDDEPCYGHVYQRVVIVKKVEFMLRAVEFKILKRKSDAALEKIKKKIGL